MKPEVVLSDRVRHVESEWRHISAVNGPIWLKCCSLMQNGMPIAVI